MKLYRLDFKMCGTAYVVADNPARAKVLFQESFEGNSSYNFNDDGDLVRDCSYETLLDEGEQVTMSPAVTMYGAFQEGDRLEEIEL